ncbi:propionyl-CoA synthetase [Prauserella marina]|uniref:Propionyl-CoA synthetase n=1 Tax=Prauserella marina TaxID=530584 RepID=A0A222VW66_9PSEU|nr:propionyl-CoA synthetase [Prauserella marina]ASR38072.1 propionyl-CoA synthetase [Prauserella marina]PWV73316.1 propionyl-CoA synthetase [Prauserella marina]SDD66546.1 propionyl-CoA synthetase [Prauserella marina]
MGAYAEIYRRSLDDREGFWLKAAESIAWSKPPSVALDASRAPLYRWFPDGELNTSYNALDRHVEQGRGDQPALIWDSPVTQSQRRYTYAELRDEVARFAGALTGLGVTKGDRVIIYLPMVPEAVIAMLGCARIGAVHSVVFGGFAPKELAARVEDAKPKVIVAASAGIEPTRVVEYKPIIEAALETTEHQPSAVVVLQRDAAKAELTERDVDWAELMASAEPADPVAVAAIDPLYILYTSGTTGKPKGVVRDTGGHAVALAWSMDAVYDVRQGDVWWTASDVGWVVGHSYIVYAPLLVGATTVIYEGKPVGTPDAGAFWRVVAEHGATALFTAPTALRAIKRVDPEGGEIVKYDLSRFSTLFMAGERLDPETYHWAHDKLGVPVIDHWWQTETGWPIAANPRGIEKLPVKPGSATVPVPGWDVRVLDQAGNELPADKEGAIAIKLPLPPGSLPTLWGDDDRFIEAYLSRYEGYYLTGDSGYLDSDGYLFVMGRTDDVINVAGHRLSTGSMEAVLAAHPAVAECAVIGVHDALKGQLPRGFVVLKAGVDIAEEQLRDELVAAVRADIGPVAAFRDVSVVEALPKTRSGKILRKTMRGIADGRDEPVPSTIEDPNVLTALRPILRTEKG